MAQPSLFLTHLSDRTPLETLWAMRTIGRTPFVLDFVVFVGDAESEDATAGAHSSLRAWNVSGLSLLPDLSQSIHIRAFSLILHRPVHRLSWPWSSV